MKRVLFRSSGYVIAAACLAWLLRDFRPSELAAGLRNADWRWIALAVVFDIAAYVCQGWRWKLLLEPLGRVSLLGATQAIYAGLFANEVLPMRAGEALRAWIVGRKLGAGAAAAVPSIVAERLLDGGWLAAALVVTARFVPLPRDLLRAAAILGAVALLLGAGLLLLGRRLAAGRAFQRLRAGLRGVAAPRRLGLAALASLLILVAQALAFWLIMRACGLPLPLGAGAAVMLLVHAGTALPNAPANVGTFQFFCTLGLGLFGVDKARAAAFSFILFILLTLPLWALGYAALSSAGVTLRRARDLAQPAN